ncbi:MAG TPA: NAD(P)/FAD-dependent oxidoreductase [Actinomycetes bacterium]|nr:NAD(P)/FAD-dependent oxidoreductase [Actinomycetes bacterium]
MSSDPDAIVVGSGPNGLVAAIRLAEAGQQVLLLEAAPIIGGGMRTEELTLPGFKHDVCSSVHPLALASPAFRALNLAREGLEFAHPSIPFGHPIDERDTALLLRDVKETARGLGRDEAAWRRIMGRLLHLGQPLVDSLLSPLDLPPKAPIALAQYGLVGAWPSQVVGGVVFREEPARALLAGVAAHSMLRMSALTTAGFGLLLGLLAHQVGWPVAVGGSQNIADALAKRLRSLGGEIVTDHRVDSLAELPPSASIVLNLSPRQVVAIAGDKLPNRYRRSLERFRLAPGVFKVDWALDGPVPWRDSRLSGAGTVHVCGTAAEVAASEHATAAGQHSERPYVLFVQASVADATRAPAGKHTGWAYCHVPNGSRVDMTDRIESQLERFAPGFRERVLARSTMDAAALEAHNANDVGGDIAGGATDWRQFLRRPVLSRSPWVTPVPGLYLCSASTPPGGGVHGMGGWHAAAEVLARA